MVALVRLKELRKKHGMTQKQLAEFLGIQEVSLQRIEYGQSRPNLENLVKLADYFDVSLDYLVGRTDRPDIFYKCEDGNFVMIETMSPATRNDTEKLVSSLLDEMRIPAHIKGYRYLREAILLILEDIENSEDCFAKIAKQFSTDPLKVERAIRHALEISNAREVAEIVSRLLENNTLLLMKNHAS